MNHSLVPGELTTVSVSQGGSEASSQGLGAELGVTRLLVIQKATCVCLFSTCVLTKYTYLAEKRHLVATDQGQKETGPCPLSPMLVFGKGHTCCARWGWGADGGTRWPEGPSGRCLRKGHAGSRLQGAEEVGGVPLSCSPSSCGVDGRRQARLGVTPLLLLCFLENLDAGAGRRLSWTPGGSVSGGWAPPGEGKGGCRRVARLEEASPAAGGG